MQVLNNYTYICLKFLHQQRINALNKIGVEKWNARRANTRLDSKDDNYEELNSRSIYYNFTSIYDKFPLSLKCIEDDYDVDQHIDTSPYLVFLFRYVELDQRIVLDVGLKNRGKNVQTVLELMSKHASLFEAEKILFDRSIVPASSVDGSIVPASSVDGSIVPTSSVDGSIVPASSIACPLIPIIELVDIVAQYYFEVDNQSSYDAIIMAHQVENNRLLIKYPRLTKCRKEICYYCGYGGVSEDKEKNKCEKCERMKNCTWRFTLGRSRCSCLGANYIWNFQLNFYYYEENLFDLRQGDNNRARWRHRKYDKVCVGNIEIT